MSKYSWVKLDDIEDKINYLSTIDIGRETVALYDDVTDIIGDLYKYDYEDVQAEEEEEG